MSPDEAIKLLKEAFEDNIEIVSGRVYERYFGFYIFPRKPNPGERVFAGNMFLVDRKSGNVLELDDLDDEAYDALMREKAYSTDLFDLFELENRKR